MIRKPSIVDDHSLATERFKLAYYGKCVHSNLVICVGNRVHIRHLSVNGLLPSTDDYVTYDGSLTQPGCQETVTWIIINKPIYISSEHVRRARSSRRRQSIYHCSFLINTVINQRLSWRFPGYDICVGYDPSLAERRA